MEYPEEGVIGIYKITSPSGKTYIGQSKCIKTRWISHKRARNQFSTPLCKSFKKYGFLTHSFEVLEECLFEELNIKERYWQDFYNVLEANGLNCVLTSTDTLPRVVSEATKLKTSISCSGKKVSEETRKKLSESLKGKVKSVEHIKKLSEASTAFFKTNPGHSKGKKVSNETKRKMSLAKKGKPLTARQLEVLYRFKNIDNQLGGDNKMAVACLNTESGIFYDTISEAAESIPIKFQTLYAMLSGRNKNKTKIIKC